MVDRNQITMIAHNDTMAQVVGVDLNENHPLPVNWVDLKLSESINLPVQSGTKSYTLFCSFRMSADYERDFWTSEGRDGKRGR